MKKNMKKNIVFSLILFSICILIYLLYSFIIKQSFLLPKNILEEIEYKEEYKDKNIDIKYGNKILGYKKVSNIKIIKQDKINTNKLKTYKIEYEAKYKSKKIKFIKKIKVVDKTSPIIEVDVKEPLNICPGSEYVNLNVKATDNYDGDLTKKVEKKLKGNKLVLKVTDSNNNSKVKIIDVLYKDVEKPTIKLNGINNEKILLNEKYIEKGATAYDNCDKDITKNIKISGNVNTNKKGIYKIKYEVEDSSKNKVEIERTVEVVNKNNMNNGKKIIYLTFDDGPYKYTNELLDILKKYDVKVTFFVTNQYPSYKNIIKRESEEGHAVAIHSYSHNYKKIYSSLDNYFNDLNQMNEIIKNQTGSYTTLVRLPGGSSNTVSRKYKKGIMTDITNELTNKGYTYFDWNVTSGDAGQTTNTKVVINNVVRSMNSNKTLVVLQHDVKKFSVDAVESIIKEGLARGYTFKALSSDSFTSHQHINN